MTTRRFSLSDGAESFPNFSTDGVMSVALMACPVGPVLGVAFAPSYCTEIYKMAYERAVASARSIRFERFRRFSPN
jgi:hypothetical protein